MNKLYRHVSSLLLAASVGLILVAIAVIIFPFGSSTDTYARESVVQLVGDAGSCSGIRIKADSGNYYILTAAHCGPLATARINPLRGLAGLTEPEFFINVKSHQGSRFETLKVIKFDPEVDLMLLESNDSEGVRVGVGVTQYEKVHTFSHGGAMPVYRTDGELVLSTYAPGGAPMTFIKTLTTSLIIPGSSGGPLLNSRNELIGITTHTDQWGVFAYCSTLAQIRVFLKGL